MSNSDSNLKEDFLEVDKPIPGQNYVCLSFVSPENTLKQKNVFLNHHFLQHFLKDKYDLSEDELKNEYEAFLFSQQKALEDQFHKENNFQTSIRGLKVRGVFDTYREAEVRSQVLQRMDRSFHVFIGQVVYWLPWDPSADHVAEQKYAENELNALVKEYKSNEQKRDLYYSEQVRQRKQDILEEEKKKKENAQQLSEEKPEEVVDVSEKTENEGNLFEDGVSSSTEKSNTNNVMEQLQSEETHEERKSKATEATEVI